MPNELRENMIMCRIDPTQSDDTKRMQVSLAKLPIRAYFVSALVQLGADHKMGTAPPSYSERDLSEWAAALAPMLAEDG